MDNRINLETTFVDKTLFKVQETFIKDLIKNIISEEYNLNMTWNFILIFLKLYQLYITEISIN